MTRRLLLSCLLVALSACDNGEPTQVQPTSALRVIGRVERGLTVRPVRVVGADTQQVAVAEMSVSPADAATVQASGDVQLLREGLLTLTVQRAGGERVSVVVDVAVPPTIVFDGLSGSNRDIYRVELDGRTLTRLTTHVANDAHPTVSGTTVLFNSFRDTTSELYVVTLAGTNERRLTRTSSNETQAALSPDARRVTYSSNASGISKVWIGSLDLAAAQPLTLTSPLTSSTFGFAGTIETTPSWAPGSDRVLFVATATPTGNAGIFIAPFVAGAVPVLVTGSGNTAPEVEPKFRFDGNAIVYASVINSATEIFVNDLGTSAVTQVTRSTGSSGQPTWLADGRVVFTTFSGGRAALFWVDPARPFELHSIPTPNISAEHAAPVRP